MTLHIHYDHRCPACDALYIPYDADVACPRCGLQEDERFDTFIIEVTTSITYNRSRYGSYVPPAWFVSSLGDNVLHILFYLFENFRRAETSDFGEFCAIYLGRINWNGHDYLARHIGAIARRVYDTMGRTVE